MRCDADIDYVCIRSEFDLLPFFREKTPWDRETKRFRDQEMVRIKATGATGRIVCVLHRLNGDVRYDVEEHRKVVREGECESLYSAEELEKIG